MSSKAHFKFHRTQRSTRIRNSPIPNMSKYVRMRKGDKIIVWMFPVDTSDLGINIGTTFEIEACRSTDSKKYYIALDTIDKHGETSGLRVTIDHRFTRISRKLHNESHHLVISLLLLHAHLGHGAELARILVPGFPNFRLTNI